MFEIPELLRKDDPVLLRPAWQKIQEDGYTGPDFDAFRCNLPICAFRRASEMGFKNLLRRVSYINERSKSELSEATGYCAVSMSSTEFTSWVGEDCMVRLAKFIEDARSSSPHAWSPDGGLGAVSFLLNGVALDLRKLIHARKRDQAREQRERNLDDVDDRLHPSGGHKEYDRVLDMIVCETALRSAEADVRRAFYLDAAGHSDKECAEQIGVTVPKLRRDRYRFRAAHRIKPRGNE
jgi:hypothetical protein